MKKLALSFAVLVFTAFTSVGQLDEGAVTFKITYDSDNEQMKAQLAMMGTGSKETIFKGDWVKEVTESGMSTSIRIMNTETKEGLLLIDIPMMGAKYAVVINEEVWDEMKENEGDEEDVDIEKTGNTKEILGYECKEVIISTEEDAEVIMYVTMDIAPNQHGEETQKVGGFPMLQEMVTSQITVTTEAVEIQEGDVSDDEFSLEIPEGYEEKTYAEIKQLGGGM